MAFQQPQQRPQSSRQLTAQPETQLDTSSWQLETQKTIEESQEWVLFSPQAPSVTERTHTTSTDRTPRTAGLSRLSDFGSLDTAAPSAQTATADDDVVTHNGTEEDDELNSLDDGLHAFHEPSDYSSGQRPRLDQSGATVLPTHDGLGTFQASSENVQNQLWQFEKYNPRRVRHRRRSSLTRHLDRLDEGQEWVEDNEKTRRIEKWRIEQSIALLEEIERETRRMRRMGKTTGPRSRTSSVATRATSSERWQGSMPGGFTGAKQDEQQPEERESFWSRFTKRILRDLMGLDENILSVILGEELPEEARMDDAATEVPDVEAALLDEPDVDLTTEPWQHRVLERIARELGVLVNHLTEHPGAFSTYLRTQELPAYAGMPNTTSPALVPEEGVAGTATSPGVFSSASNPHNPYFPPTVQTPLARATSYSEASLWGIEEEEEGDQEPIPGVTDEAERLRREKEHWERELDVKMVFNFLKQRFGSRAPPSSSADFLPRPRPYPIDAAAEDDQPPRRAGASTPVTAARRQAMIRHHHPLVGGEASRVQHQKRREREREMLARQQHYGIPQHMRSGSGSIRTSPKSASLASQTSAKSSNRKRTHSGSSKSRNFWDVGGSQVGSASGIGVWGEA